MTICFSIKKPAFIVTGTDVLAENTITHTSVVRKKFLVNVRRNFVVLISGSFLTEKPAPEPRELLIKRMDEIITKNDPMLTVTKKLSELISRTYAKTDIANFHLQICGFDGKISRIYAISNTQGISEDSWFRLSGAPAIIDYGKSKEGQSRITVLGQTVPNPEIIQEGVRKFVTEAIDYENKMALAKGEKPKTGGGINIVTVFPNYIVWSDPRADSKDDPYQLGVR